ncbi:CAP domain-containing protein [Paraliomyxa miuraensis]|uniref:CAP domain-containing protein n=1 Tax=Paraliomyxa miuraensis TaxID=376150 RepID=UPI00224E5DF4|nr:CAP domain-containing protein [Paraliomyxa miuraensis]
MVGLLVGCPPSPPAKGTSPPSTRRGRSTPAVAEHHAVAPSPADLEGIELRMVEIRIQTPMAKKYGGKVEHALTGPEKAVLDAMNGLPVTHLPALSRMVRALAQSAPDWDTIPSVVGELMAWLGLPDPYPRLIKADLPRDPLGCATAIAPGCEHALASLVEQVEAAVPEGSSTLIGVGVVAMDDGTTRMLVALLDRAVELEPVPSVLRGKGTFTLGGKLLGPRTKPRVELVGPDGRWESMPVSLSVSGRFSSKVSCKDGQGAYQVEVFAEGPYGPEVAANFPVYCGVSPPNALTARVEVLGPSVTAAQVARANFLYLNEARQERGLAPLSWDPEAAAIAEAHSLDMAEHGFVGHKSPTTGGTTDRFLAAGVVARVVRENVALDFGPKGIHDSLMRSPLHRVNILAPDVTHVGIGAVFDPHAPADDRRPVYLTQNFFKKDRAATASGELGVATLRGAVDEARGEQAKPPISWSDGLSAIAQRLADARSRGRADPKGWTAEVGSLGYASVESNVLSSISFDAIVEAEMWTSGVPQEADVGVGLARTKESGGVEGYLVVVLVAERASGS